MCGSPTNPKDSLTISRGLAAAWPVTPGKYATLEILKESFIDVALNEVVYIKDSFRIPRLMSEPPGCRVGGRAGGPPAHPGGRGFVYKRVGGRNRKLTGGLPRANPGLIVDESYGFADVLNTDRCGFDDGLVCGFDGGLVCGFDGGLVLCSEWIFMRYANG